jgi:hypothetical protein
VAESEGFLRAAERKVMEGLILNPRGTSGSGKTELARRILADIWLEP